jgi:hypothetical protein
MRFGWVPVVSYEIGRALGLSAAGIGATSSKDVVVGLVLLLLLISAGMCATSSSSDAYIRTGS